MPDRVARFDLIVCITVLQHVLDDENCCGAIRALADRLSPRWRIVLLDTVPRRSSLRCDSDVFRARTEREYLRGFDQAWLELEDVRGVDSTPLKIWYLPFHRRLPLPLGWAALGLATLCSLPFDLAFGRVAGPMAWNKVFSLRAPR